jgi:hypothetical protein
MSVVRVKFLIIVLCVGFCAGAARSEQKQQPVQFEGENLKFTYHPYEGGQAVPCTHKPYDRFLIDWTVHCTTADQRFEREYRVHLLFRQVQRPRHPQSSFELLYWVTELSVSPIVVSNGPSLWFHFSNLAEWSGLSVGQPVDQGTAGLYLQISGS